MILGPDVHSTITKDYKILVFNSTVIIYVVSSKYLEHAYVRQLVLNKVKSI
jgi:hypothetical protein